SFAAAPGQKISGPLFEGGQSLLVAPKLGQRHPEQCVCIGKSGLQFQSLAKRRNRLLELALLIIDEPESTVDLSSPGRELLQLLVCLLRLRVALRSKSSLSRLRIPFEIGIRLRREKERSRHEERCEHLLAR